MTFSQSLRILETPTPRFKKFIKGRRKKVVHCALTSDSFFGLTTTHCEALMLALLSKLRAL